MKLERGKKLRKQKGVRRIVVISVVRRVAEVFQRGFEFFSELRTFFF